MRHGISKRKLGRKSGHRTALLRNMAAALEDGRLVVVEAEGHTGYSTGRCATAAIDDYLVDPVANAPEDGATCP